MSTKSSDRPGGRNERVELPYVEEAARTAIIPCSIAYRSVRQRLFPFTFRIIRGLKPLPVAPAAGGRTTGESSTVIVT